jgi:magnesium-transporting ATPase (P-type)
LNGALIARAYLFLGLLEGRAAIAAFFYALHRGGWHESQALARDGPLYSQATTACLSVIVASQIADAFLCRSSWNSAFKLSAFTNLLLLMGIVVEIGLILLIDYTPLGNLVFGTAAVPLSVWPFVVPCVTAMFGLEEIRKWLVRRWADPLRRPTLTVTSGGRRAGLGAPRRAL